MEVSEDAEPPDLAMPRTVDPVGLDLEIRRVDHESPAERNHVLALLREYYAADEGYAERRYRWLYRDNPHGQARTYLATHRTSGAPVGLTSVFPRQAIVGGQLRLGAIGGDGYVPPAFRKMGIVTALHRAALADMGTDSDQVGFMYGPPEPNNLKGLLRAGSVVVGEVQRLSRVLHPRALGPHSRSLPTLLANAITRALVVPSSKLHVEWCSTTPDARVDRVWKKVAPHKKGIFMVRDATFYSWRFSQSPSGEQAPCIVFDRDEPIGTGVLERRGARAAIVDVMSVPWRQREVLRALLLECKQFDAVHIAHHAPSLTGAVALLGLGFIVRTRKAFQVQAPLDHPDRTLLLRASAWEYSWGDGDVDKVT